MSVVLTLTGYLVGMLSGRLAGWLHTRVRGAPQAESPRWLQRGQVAIVVALLVGGLTFTPSGLGWQSDQADSVGWAVPSWLTVMVLTPVLVVGVVMIGRGVRAAARWLARQYGRVLPYRLARVAGVVTAAGLLASLVAGMGWYQTNQFEALNLRTDLQQQPTTALRSGGPGSLVEWADLGRQGRTFVMGGPSARAIAGFTGEPALEPIRVYVGMDNAPSPQQRAELAVAELERTGAFDRAKLVIVVTSGLGAVHPVSAIALEFAAGGDVATVATQYSYLPSFMTAVLDPDGAEREARALIPAVLDAVNERPEGQRPEVYLHGESLGALGSQRYLLDQSPQEVVADFAGVLWIGTPAASELVDRWADYDTGTPGPSGAVRRDIAAPVAGGGAGGAGPRGHGVVAGLHLGAGAAGPDDERFRTTGRGAQLRARPRGWVGGCDAGRGVDARGHRRVELLPSGSRGAGAQAVGRRRALRAGCPFTARSDSDTRGKGAG